MKTPAFEEFEEQLLRWLWEGSYSIQQWLLDEYNLKAQVMVTPHRNSIQLTLEPYPTKQ